MVQKCNHSFLVLHGLGSLGIVKGFFFIFFSFFFFFLCLGLFFCVYVTLIQLKK